MQSTFIRVKLGLHDPEMAPVPAHISCVLLEWSLSGCGGNILTFSDEFNN
jgi:hypothetical protein